MKISDDEKYMAMAIAKAKQGVKRGQTPFGACIVRRGKVIALAHNTVFKSTDITSHAEVHAIRIACKKIGSVDLSGATIYSTCEPCPMCFSACHWAKISTIVYGAKISDAQKAGFNELHISNRKMKSQGGSPIKIQSGIMKKENIELFRFWKSQKNKKVY